MFKVSTISEPIFFIYAINATKLKYRWYHLRGCWPLPQPSRFLISNAHSSLNITMFKDVTKQHNYVRTIFLYIPMYIYEYTYLNVFISSKHMLFKIAIVQYNGEMYLTMCATI